MCRSDELFVCVTSAASIGLFESLLTLTVVRLVNVMDETMKLDSSEALQMQRDRATRQKYEMSHLKRLAIGEPSKTLKIITVATDR